MQRRCRQERPGNYRANKGSGKRCLDGWGSHVMGKGQKVRGHLVDGYKEMPMMGPGE